MLLIWQAGCLLSGQGGWGVWVGLGLANTQFSPATTKLNMANSKFSSKQLFGCVLVLGFTYKSLLWGPLQNQEFPNVSKAFSGKGVDKQLSLIWHLCFLCLPGLLLVIFVCKTAFYSSDPQNTQNYESRKTRS